MPLTRVSPSLIAVANNVTSNVFGSANTIPSLTFDASGVISTASNTAIQINTADIVNSAITDAKITAVANTKITGNIISSQIASNITLNGNTTVTTLVAGAGSNTAPAITTAGDTNTGIFFSAADTIDFTEGGTAVGQFDSSANFKFNSGFGSVETAYGCRAWVNFNGTGTVAIRASGNVSSITDNGTGDYTVNFTTAMPDANYSAVATLYSDRTGANIYGLVAGINTLATGSFQIDSLAGASVFAYFDSLFVNVAVFR